MSVDRSIRFDSMRCDACVMIILIKSIVVVVVFVAAAYFLFSYAFNN